VPEALAAGTPVVLPRLGCLPEWVEASGGGILVEPGDAAALADGLEALLCDPARARDLGRQGRDVVRARFSSRAMAEETARTLEAFVSRHPVKME
jgi:glycosyltransferase involved in cell wall biosynthesis